jgi:hypothetical protein
MCGAKHLNWQSDSFVSKALGLAHTGKRRVWLLYSSWSSIPGREDNLWRRLANEIVRPFEGADCSEISLSSAQKFADDEECADDTNFGEGFLRVIAVQRGKRGSAKFFEIQKKNSPTFGQRI